VTRMTSRRPIRINMKGPHTREAGPSPAEYCRSSENGISDR
jgi:hypothetical protein